MALTLVLVARTQFMSKLLSTDEVGVTPTQELLLGLVKVDWVGVEVNRRST